MQQVRIMTVVRAVLLGSQLYTDVGCMLCTASKHAHVLSIISVQAHVQVIGMASSLEEVMKKAEQAVESDSVETVTMSIATQRARKCWKRWRFGTFLRDVETDVDNSYGLLTPLRITSGSEDGGSQEGGPGGMLPA